MELNKDRSWPDLLGPRFIWAYILGAAALIAILANFRGGYVGGDYSLHLARMLDSAKVFDFSGVPDPPPYYFFDHLLYLLIGKNNGFPITLSIIQVLISSYAVWKFAEYTEPLFKSRLVHFSLVVFLAFLPVRVIHTASIETDWTTIPVFVLLLFLFERFRRGEEGSTLRNAAYIGVALGLGVWSKYSFISVVPVFLLLFLYLAFKREWTVGRLVAVCAITLILPSVLFIYSGREIMKADGFAAHIWLPKEGAPGQPDMDYYDLLSVKAADVELLKAPEEFTPDPSDNGNYHIGFRLPHKHSYLGLSHLSTFSDTMNLFQNLPVEQNLDAYLIPDFKRRDPWKTTVMQAAMTLGVIWTLLALIGTPWLFVAAVFRYFGGKLEREHVVAMIGMAYFLLLFLPIPYVYSGNLNGYWMARLIMLPLMFFFLAGFLLYDRKLAVRSEKLGYAILVLAIVQASIEAITMI